MACDEDYLMYRKNTPAGILIQNLNKMSKKPTIDSNLDECLDSFIKQLHINQNYLSNGIFNIKFAEAALFLQSSVQLYCKKVDLLWDNIVEYHMQLCTYNKESKDETEKIMQRMKSAKRKKVAQEVEDERLRRYQDLSALCKQADEVEATQTHSIAEKLRNNLMLLCQKGRGTTDQPKKQDVIEIRSDDDSSNSEMGNVQGVSEEELEIRAVRPEMSENDDVLEDGDSMCEEAFENCDSDNELDTTGTELLHFPSVINSPIYDIYGEQLCNYSDLYLNCHVPFYPSLSAHHGLTEDHEDKMLCGFLWKKNIDYDTYCNQGLEDEFRAFIQEQLENMDVEEEVILNHFIKPTLIQKVQNLCPLSCVVNITRLPNELMTKCMNSKEANVKAILEEPLTTNDKQNFARKNSEAISDVNSVFNDEGFNEMETDTESECEHIDNSMNTTSQRSSTDSGVFCNSFSENEQTKETNALEMSNGSVCGISNVQPLLEKDPVAVLPVPTDSIIEITKSRQIEKQTKRKICSDDDEDDQIVKRRKSRFRWLKTTTTTLREFEKFFRHNYVPEPSEGCTLLPLSDDDENEDDFDNGSQNFKVIEINEIPSSHLENEPLVQPNAAMENLENTVVFENDSNYIVNLNLSTEELNTNDTTPSTQKISDTVNYSDIMGRFNAVIEWKNFMRPKLKALEASPKFDIHEYGTRIMNAIPSNGSLSFKDVSDGKPAADVCRLFMASLQLANTNNIELITISQGELANDKLEMKLLTKDRYHEHLVEYEAPSEHTYKEKLARVQAIRFSSSSKEKTHTGVVKTNAKKRKLC